MTLGIANPEEMKNKRTDRGSEQNSLNPESRSDDSLGIAST